MLASAIRRVPPADVLYSRLPNEPQPTAPPQQQQQQQQVYPDVPLTNGTLAEAGGPTRQS